MIELYHFRNSVCSQKVRIALAEKGLDWSGHEVNLFASEQYDPNYLKLNPKGVVPTLVHDGQPVIESTLICEYIDATWPDPPLRPTDAAGLADMRLWGKAVDEGLHVGVMSFSFSAMFRERMKQMPEEDRQKRYRNVGDPQRRDVMVSLYEDGVESPFVMNAIAAFDSAFGKIDKALSKSGGPWILGDTYSLAEINLAPYVARLEFLTLLDIFIADRRTIQPWWNRVKSRAGYRDGMLSLMSDEEIEEMQTAGAKIQKRIAERRDEHLDFKASAGVAVA